MLHVISTQCVSLDLHTIVPGPLEHTCWRQFAAHWGDCKNLELCLWIQLLLLLLLLLFWDLQSILRTTKHGNCCGVSDNVHAVQHGESRGECFQGAGCPWSGGKGGAAAQGHGPWTSSHGAGFLWNNPALHRGCRSFSMIVCEQSNLQMYVVVCVSSLWLWCVGLWMLDAHISMYISFFDCRRTTDRMWNNN